MVNQGWKQAWREAFRGEYHSLNLYTKLGQPAQFLNLCSSVMKRVIYLNLGRADLPVRLFPAPIRTNRATSKPKQADQQVRPTYGGGSKPIKPNQTQETHGRDARATTKEPHGRDAWATTGP